MQKTLDYLTTIFGLGLAVIHGVSSLASNPSVENCVTTAGLAILGFFGFKNSDNSAK